MKADRDGEGRIDDMVLPLKRTTFTTTRVLEFFSEKELNVGWLPATRMLRTPWGLVHK